MNPPASLSDGTTRKFAPPKVDSNNTHVPRIQLLKSIVLDLDFGRHLKGVNSVPRERYILLWKLRAQKIRRRPNHRSLAEAEDHQDDIGLIC